MMDQENLWLLGYPEEFFEKAVLAPEFFVDLNMDQIVDQIMVERRHYDLRRYFNRMPEELEVTKKRQEVQKALGDADFFEGLLKFSDYMLCARGYAADYQEAERELCRQKLLLDCGEQYILALDTLSKAFSAGRGRKSRGVRMVGTIKQRIFSGYLRKNFIHIWKGRNFRLSAGKQRTFLMNLKICSLGWSLVVEGCG